MWKRTGLDKHFSFLDNGERKIPFRFRQLKTCNGNEIIRREKRRAKRWLGLLLE
jgi:hypothetical protein